MGIKVMIETGAGINSTFTDENYIENHACICKDSKSLYKQCNVIIKVRAIEENDVELLQEESVYISLLNPSEKPEYTSLINALARRKITAFALEKIPRTTMNQQ